ncbi:uncharacterized protein KGF55_002876 [Candida pseudojiufengensis]|uniref:uncharacterized protein n=1 Tax=Candida pseudojiufengensis TaxID=497109 RepID=UPI0022242744|nr:uncharacterized protein KGF55_002876 [Candida pseudojiufengensis]KAI5963084.1 hypothetical protein KGF55_002876 [Candida pseudojiufengensis]
MKKKVPKLSKKQIQQSQKNSSNPLTAEEYLEQGSLDEESGDRWLGSDLAKALRFYQKAYNSYLKSIQLGDNGDSYYNSSRLLLHVYLLIKSDGLNLENLVNLDEVYNSEHSVIESPESILNLHLRSLETVGENQDLLFNTAIVYIEILESSASNDDELNLDNAEAIRLFNSARDMLIRLAHDQYVEFESFIEELKQLKNDDEDDNNKSVFNQSKEGEGKKEEVISEKVIQPVDLFETVIASFRLIQALYNCLDSDELLPEIKAEVQPIEFIATKIAKVITFDYSQNDTDANSMLENITKAQAEEIAINMTILQSLQLTDVQDVIKLWEESFKTVLVDDTPEKYLAFSDQLQTQLDRKDITLQVVNKSNDINDKQTFFDILKYQNQALAKAQDLVNSDLANKRNQPSGKESNLGATIAQLCDVLIERADIFYQWSSMIDFETSMKNKDIYLTNCKNLLKSAMNLSNTSGGLRERAIEKMNRDKKKYQSVFRLCLIENKISIEELDKIMTRNKWIKEYTELSKINTYDEKLRKIPIASIT